ncbi:MAG: hypothetical protein ACE5GO_05230 [Anaerolineales bacterium]
METTPPEQPILTPTPTEDTSIQPALPPIMGMEINRQDYNEERLELVIRSGTYWLRLNGVIWSKVEPNEGERDWDSIADLEIPLRAAAEAGMEVILIVRSTPSWAQRDDGVFCGPVHPDKLESFAAFVRDTVTRYSQPPFNVAYWELWNEPEVGVREARPTSPYGCWGDPGDPYYGGGYYAEVLEIVYPQIKVVNPDAQVLVGGLLLDCDPINPPLLGDGQPKDCTNARYLEGILLNGGGDYFDGISFHAYDYYNGSTYGNPNWGAGRFFDEPDGKLVPVLAAKARYLRNLLTQYGHPGKFLINTETALICGRDGTEPPCQAEEFIRTKARYLVQSYVVAAANGLRGNVWYSLTGWRGSGLVPRNAEPTLAYTAYQFIDSQLTGAVFMREIPDLPGILVYEFRKDEKTLWALWSMDGELVEVTLPAMPTASFDTFGEPLSPVEQFYAGAAPIFVEWGP